MSEIQTKSESFNADLTVFVPTRDRPDQLLSFATQFDATKRGNTKVVFVIDEDDPQLGRYKAKNDNRWECYVAGRTRRGMVGALNECFRWYAKSGRLGFAVGFMGDDHRPRTDGWDSRYLSELQNLGTGFVYGNDLFQFDRMPTQVAFTTDIGLALGYMCPPQLMHLWVDVIWKDLGDAIGRITYLEDVIVEHMHPLAGKSLVAGGGKRMDKAYKAVNSNLVIRNDRPVYDDYHSSGKFAEDVGRIKMVIENGYYENDL